MFAGRNMMFVMGVASTPPPSGTASLALTWEDNSAIEDGYRLRYRTAGSGSYTLGTTTAANATSGTITGLAFNAAYDVQIESFNASGTSEVYPSSIAYTVPQNPPVLSISNISYSEQLLAWTIEANPVNGGFLIEQLISGSWEPIFTPAASERSYPSTGRISSTSYSYRIRAYNNNTGSQFVTPWSNTAMLTTSVVPDGWESFYSVSTLREPIVQTIGALVVAVSVGRPASEGVRTINGVPFTSELVAGNYLYPYQDNALFASTGHSGAENNLDIVMRGTMYDGTSITFTGLTIGQKYRLQVFAADERSGSTGNTVTYTVAGMTSPAVALNPAHAGSCVFTAASTSVVLTPGYFIQAFQLRAI